MPVRLSTFIGREAELDGLAVALSGARLLTLTGPGGCGKTRLALHLAADRLADFRDGVWWVDLARVRDARVLGEAVVEAIGLRESATTPSQARIIEHLALSNALIVLDNCEHIVEETASLATEILRACPQVKIIATSQRPLDVEGEQVEPVPPLATPPDDQPDESSALTFDAVRLFIERARTAGSKVAIDVPAINEVCRRLNGMPLAIELAAARTRALAPRQIADALGDRFRLLTGGSQSALPRHQSLLASVEWSHELLDDRERMLFRRLAVFNGGFTLESASAVAAGDDLDASDIRDVLVGLIDKSFVQSGDRSRYLILETLREYGIARLADASETEETFAKHVDHFCSLVESLQPRVARADRDAVQLIADEHANIGVAVERASSAGRPEPALRIVAHLSTALWMRGLYAEGKTWFETALKLPDGPPELRARALSGLAEMSFYAGDAMTLMSAAHEALELARRSGDEWTIARTLNPLGGAMSFVNLIEGRRMLEESIATARRTDDKWCLANSLLRLAYTWLMQQERYDETRALVDEAVTITREIQASTWDDWIAAARSWIAASEGDIRHALDVAQDGSDAEIIEPMSRVLRLTRGAMAASELGETGRADELVAAAVNLYERTGGDLMGTEALGIAKGMAARARGDVPRASADLAEALASANSRPFPFLKAMVRYRAGEILLAAHEFDDARSSFAEAAELGRTLDNGLAITIADLGLAWVALARDDFDAAEKHAHEGLAALISGGYWRWMPDAFELFGAIARVAQRLADGVRFHAVADGLRRAMELVPSPDEKSRFEAEIACLLEDLGREAFDEAWSDGAMLSRDDAIAYARRGRGTRSRPSTGWASLTPTELQVAELAAEGLTNPEIGRRLFVSAGTAKTHLSHIYAKLGIGNRAELAAVVATRRNPA